MEAAPTIPEGEDVEFETVKEDWNEYRLSDGATLKIKLVLVKVLRTNQYDQTGDPIYVVNSTNVVKAKVPKELKQKPSPKHPTVV